jgi:hypothetical protein
VIRSWGAKARWDGPLPQHFHGDHAAGRWRWDNPASAHTVRVNTAADGTGGERVEAWADKLHATRIEIFAEPIEAVTERPEQQPRDAHDPHAPGHADDADAAGGRSIARLHQPGHGPDEIDHPATDHPTPGPRVRGEHPPNDGATTAAPRSAQPDDRLAGAIAQERLVLLRDGEQRASAAVREDAAARSPSASEPLLQLRRLLDPVGLGLHPQPALLGLRQAAPRKNPPICRRSDGAVKGRRRRRAQRACPRRYRRPLAFWCLSTAPESGRPPSTNVGHAVCPIERQWAQAKPRRRVTSVHHALPDLEPVVPAASAGGRRTLMPKKIGRIPIESVIRAANLVSNPPAEVVGS